MSDRTVHDLLIEALDGIVGDRTVKHVKCPGPDLCAVCSREWPCPHARAAEILDGYRRDV